MWRAAAAAAPDSNCSRFLGGGGDKRSRSGWLPWPPTRAHAGGRRPGVPSTPHQTSTNPPSGTVVYTRWRPWLGATECAQGPRHRLASQLHHPNLKVPGPDAWRTAPAAPPTTSSATDRKVRQRATTANNSATRNNAFKERVQRRALSCYIAGHTRYNWHSWAAQYST